MNALVVLLWSAAVTLVLIVVGIFITLVMMDRITLFSSAEDSPAKASGVTAQVDTSYRVLILNATPQTGLVAEVRKQLVAEGWADDAVIGSEGTTDAFDTTTVFYVEKADEAAALGLAQLLGDAVVEKSDFYAELGDSDSPELTVVLGLDQINGTTTGESGDAEDAPAN